MTVIERTRPTGDEGAQRGRWEVLVIFWVVLALVCAAGAVLAILDENDPAPAACPPPRQCGTPPVLPAAELRTWSDHTFDFRFQYSPKLLRVEDHGDGSVRLRVRAARPDDVEGEVWVSAFRAEETSTPRLVRERRDDLSVSILGLTEDEDPATLVLNPLVGNKQSLGGSYRGTVDTPQGPTVPAVALILAATDGEISVVISYTISGTSNSDEVRTLRAYLDAILTSFTWSTERAAFRP
jgi:hypothetical protein